MRIFYDVCLIIAIGICYNTLLPIRTQILTYSSVMTYVNILRQDLSVLYIVPLCLHFITCVIKRMFAFGVLFYHICGETRDSYRLNIFQIYMCFILFDLNCLKFDIRFITLIDINLFNNISTFM